jgi:hypothetical protein
LINSYLKTFKQLLNPLIYTPMVFVMIVLLIVQTITNDFLENLFIEFLINEDILVSSPLAILLNNIPAILIILASFFVILYATILGALVLVRVAKEKDLITSINDTVLDFFKGLGVSFYFMISLVIFIVFGFLIISGLEIIYNLIQDALINYIISFFILPPILFLIATVILIKTIFVLPALIDNNLRESISKAFLFTNGRLIKTTIFLISLLVIYLIIQNIMYELIKFLPAPQLNFYILIFSEIFLNTMFFLAISNYYFNETSQKEEIVKKEFKFRKRK